MEIRTEENEGVITVFPKGAIDTTTAPEAEAFFNAEISDDARVILDMKRVNYLSSAGLRVVLNLMKKVGYDHMVLRNMTPEVTEIFRMTGFDRIINIQQ